MLPRLYHALDLTLSLRVAIFLLFCRLQLALERSTPMVGAGRHTQGIRLVCLVCCVSTKPAPSGRVSTKIGSLSSHYTYICSAFSTEHFASTDSLASTWTYFAQPTSPSLVLVFALPPAPQYSLVVRGRFGTGTRKHSAAVRSNSGQIDATCTDRILLRLLNEQV